MARPWRIEFPGAVYHVMSRGNKWARVFYDDQDRKLFLERLAKATDRFHLDIYAFCLMSNHFHLFLRTEEGNLSRAMHWIISSYSGRFNRRHNESGHLFQGRYKSILVSDDSYWINLSIYIHLNPVRADLVADPGQYFWSSFREYSRLNSRFPWLNPERVLLLYGRDGVSRRRNYRRKCIELSGEDQEFWEQFRTEVILGSREVYDKLAKRHRPEGDTTTVPDFNQARRPPEVGAALEQVASAFGVEIQQLKRRRRDQLRQIAYYHLVNNCGLPPAEIGREFGVGVSAVSMAVKRLVETMRNDPLLADKINRLCEM